MSADYPSRGDWLKVRSTPRKRPVRFLHVSTRFQHIVDEDSGVRTVVTTKGKTYRRKA